MSDHPHRARRLLARGTVSVAVVLALSGALFAANARFAQASGERHPEDLDDLARTEITRVDRLTSEVDTLRADVDTRAQQAVGEDEVGTPSPGYVLEGGSTPVTGPGLTVRLDDAPADSPHRGEVSPDVLVVHQQDVQAVMNALWAGGAEAMSLMDQRVVSTSAFRCVGNVLRLHGLVFSPPYVVRAVGDPDQLRKSLDQSPAVRAFERDADSIGLGWSVDSSSHLELPAYAGATELQFAHVPEGTPVLPGLDAPQEAPAADDEEES